MQFLWVDAFFLGIALIILYKISTRIKLEKLFTIQMVKNKLYLGKKE